MRHILIIGGGFSGTMTAVNLARLAEAPLKVTVVNHGYPASRGVAYSTRRPEHLLNVAARNMSALPDHPNHFLEWLRTRSEFADTPEPELRETFMPRQVYGDYLRSLALHYTRPLDRRCRIEFAHVEAEVISLTPAAQGWNVHLGDGSSLQADKVVLACGNEPPGSLPGAEALSGHPAWCPNPWLDLQGRLPPAGGSILLLGTGLTTVDAIVTLCRLNWQGTIHAVSRNGLLPRAHFKGIAYEEFPPPDIDLANLGLEALKELLETHCARLAQLGANPGIVVDKMRPHTQRVWRNFTLEEKRTFAARDAARWNVIRHRIAPSIHRQVTEALETGRLQIHAASILRLEPAGDRIRAVLKDAEGHSCELEGALVINATGPHTRFSKTRSPLLQNLLAAGIVRPDDMDMGIRVTDSFAAANASGGTSSSLFAIGPLLRGTLWESIAVPELRSQALSLAQTLLEDEVIPATRRRWTPAEDTLVMEYYI